MAEEKLVQGNNELCEILEHIKQGHNFLLSGGAGSGKTTVLINRIANIMRYGRGSDWREIPDTVTEDDVEFLEQLSSDCSEYDRWRADTLCAVEPAAPWSIIAITFTNKAAREMQTRISTQVGQQAASQLWMGTFHSIFCRILRYEADRIGFHSDFTIDAAADSKTLITALIKHFADMLVRL